MFSKLEVIQEFCEHNTSENSSITLGEYMESVEGFSIVDEITESENLDIETELNSVYTDKQRLVPWYSNGGTGFAYWYLEPLKEHEDTANVLRRLKEYSKLNKTGRLETIIALLEQAHKENDRDKLNKVMQTVNKLHEKIVEHCKKEYAWNWYPFEKGGMKKIRKFYLMCLQNMNEPGPETASSYWSYTGDNPVLTDSTQQWQSKESEGGFNRLNIWNDEDFLVRTELEKIDIMTLRDEKREEQTGKIPLSESHAIYLKRKKEEREARTEKLENEMLNNPKQARKIFYLLYRDYLASVKKCAEKNNFSDIVLSKVQVNYLRLLRDKLLEQEKDKFNKAIK